MYFDRSATMSDAKRQFSRWGGGSAGMHRPVASGAGRQHRGDPGAEEAGDGAPDPHLFWLGLPERGASTAETPEQKGRGAGLPDPHPF